MLDKIFERKEKEDFILIWNAKTKVSKWFQDAEEAEQYAMDEAKNADMYFGLGISPKDYGKFKRCKANDVVGISCFWIDIDVKGENHQKQNLPETFDDGMAMVFKQPWPSYVVSTGGGLHAYWQLDRVYTKKEVGDGLKMWQQSFSGGFDIDATHDFSRVLRVPDTFNHKNDKMQEVTLTSDVGNCYKLSDLQDILKTKRIQILCENDDEFEKIWNHKLKRGDQSQSAVDMRIANYLKKALFHPDDIKEYLKINRKKFSPKSVKNNMEQYLDLTLSKVFSGDSTPVKDFSEGETIIKIQKTSGSEPTYYILYSDMSRIKLGCTDELLSFRKYSKRFFEEKNRIPQRLKQVEWDDVINSLSENIEVIDTGEESREDGLLKNLLTNYVASISIMDKAEVDDNTTIIKTAEGLWLPAQHLRQWLKEVYGLIYSNAKYSVLMKEIGLEPKIIRTGSGIRFQTWGAYHAE